MSSEAETIVGTGSGQSGPEAQLRGAGGCSSTPQPKKVYPVIRPDPMTFFSGGVGYLHLHYYEHLLPLFQNSLITLTRVRLPANLYFCIDIQLTIVEVLSEGTL